MATLLTKDKLEKTKFDHNTLKFAYVRCSSCGLRYRYIENGLYRPKTCSEYRCVKRSLHSNIFIR
jgi:hypothetical protein